MALVPIDLDRGVTQRIAGIAGQQLMVCMYDDDPGIYYAPNGAVLTHEVAKQAGFDVEGDLRERERRKLRSEALAEIDRRFDVMPEGEIVDENGVYQVVHIGNGWFDVVDGDGQKMNAGRLRKAAAIEFMNILEQGKTSQSRPPSDEEVSGGDFTGPAKRG